MFATCVTSISCPVSQVYFVLSFVFVFLFVSLYSRSMPSRRRVFQWNGAVHVALTQDVRAAHREEIAVVIVRGMSAAELEFSAALRADYDAACARSGGASAGAAGIDVLGNMLRRIHGQADGGRDSEHAVPALLHDEAAGDTL